MPSRFIVYRVIVIASYQGKEHKNPSLLSPDKTKKHNGIQDKHKTFSAEGGIHKCRGCTKKQVDVHEIVSCGAWSLNVAVVSVFGNWIEQKGM